MLSTYSCDVAVIGAGPAGIAAAASAGERNARVILIDCAAGLGGSVTAAMHRSICGLYAAAPRDTLDTLNGGLQRRLVARMMRKEPSAVLPRQFGRVWVLEFPTLAWESSLNDLCSDANVDLRLSCRVAAVRRDGAHLTAIRLEGVSPGWIDANVVIDCTGNGEVLQLAGEDALLPREDTTGRMLGGFALRLSGLCGNLELLRLQTPYVLAKAVEEDLLPAAARFTCFYPGPGSDEGVCKIALNPEDFSISGAEQIADRVLEILVKGIPEFAAARIVEKSPRALPRDGRRLRGKYVVSAEDVLSGRRHGPNTVHAWWPLEHWDVSKGPTYAYPPLGEHYDIPDDALRSAVLDNLLAAGNCLSATSVAAASIRASGICLATGDAAGRLAAQECGQ